MAWRSDFHFDFSKSISTLHVLRRITKRLLPRNIPSDFCRYPCDGFTFAREVSDSSGIFAKPLEKTRVFFLVTRTDQGNGIDQGLRLASLCLHLRIFEMAGIVSAVADDDERLLLQMPVLQMMETLADSIIERGSSPRGDGREGFPEFLRIV